MQRIFSILAVCLLTAAVVQKSDAACDTETKVASYELCQDFRDIRNLIDPNTLVYYMAYGYRSDENFQTAMKYIESDSFESVSDQIANSAPYTALLQRFSDAGVNTSVIASISNLFKCVLMGRTKYGDEEDIDLDDLDNLEMQSAIVPRTLTDITTKLKSEIPKDKLCSLIRHKLEADGDFAKFYKIVRSSKFRKAAKKMFTSYQLRYPLKTLTHNKIDLKKLAKLADEILGWCPTP